MSHFFAYMSRMKYIQRWGLMRNTQPENIQEHSLQVAMIAHCLAVIRNTYFNGALDPEKVALLAIYHEAQEVITGDLATPIKYFSPEIRKAYKDIEMVASDRLFSMLPEEMKEAYRPLLYNLADDKEELKLVKYADKICAYIKCVEEMKSGNSEFACAYKTIREDINAFDSDEVRFFMDKFAESFSLTLDEMA
ncbi:MAG TPA: 5'-deoxynucleotidase [Clostridia bacterium]|nr:5'-deoxynucleotidase [Clostridia bacterium]